MGDPLSIASGIPALSAFAFNSSVSLYQLVKSVQNNKREFLELTGELEALSNVIQLLQQLASKDGDQFKTLCLPLLRCGQACKDFEEIIANCTKRFRKSKTSFHDWAKLQYLGRDIVDFKNILAGYKAVIGIAIQDISLRTAAVGASAVLEFKSMLKDTKTDLEVHLENLNNKLEALRIHESSANDENIAGRRRIQEEIDSVKECLSVCAQGSERAEKVRTNVFEDVGFEDLLRQLPYAEDAHFNAYSTQHELTYLDNTRVDLLREIHSWADGQDERCIFWLNGLAGTGKSTVARTVARSYSNRERLAASFFFSRGRGDVGHAGKFVTSIAAQLACNIPALKQRIIDAVVERDHVANQSLRDQWHHLVLGPLSKLSDNDCPASLVLVVDALDECNSDENIRIIVQLLAEVRSSTGVRLRVFLTSRPAVSIRHGFRQVADSEHKDVVLLPETELPQLIRAGHQHDQQEIVAEPKLRTRRRIKSVSDPAGKKMQSSLPLLETKPEDMPIVLSGQAETLAEACGWQPGRPKFLWELQAGTPLEETDRRLLGRGAVGEVHEVKVPGCRETMARKRIYLPRIQKQAMRDRVRIKTEVEILRSLNHAHIVKILGCFEEATGRSTFAFCALMYPAADEDLAHFLYEDCQQISEEQKEWISNWYACLASALAYMHAQGIHHEDIKPKNIVHHGRRIYFTDFSSSRRLEAGQDTSTDSPAMASWLFAAPEAMAENGLVFMEMLVVSLNVDIEQMRDVLFGEVRQNMRYCRVINEIAAYLTNLMSPKLSPPLWERCLRDMLDLNRQARPNAEEVLSVLIADPRLGSTESCSCCESKKTALLGVQATASTQPIERV